MKILLVKPSCNYSSEVTPPVGLGYLASVACQAGHELRILDGRLCSSEREAYRQILDGWRPDVIGITAVTYDAAATRDLVNAARSTSPEVKIVVGGPFAWSDPESALLGGMVDYAVVGEGERTFLALIGCFERGQDTHDIPGIAYWSKGNKGIINPPGSLIEDLDDLPFPAWDLLDNGGLFSSAQAGIYL